MLANTASALPDTLATFPKVSGVIKEIKKGELCSAVWIELDGDTKRAVARKVHSALKRKTYYPFKTFRQPAKGEALLLFTGKELKSLKVGEKIVVHGYSIIADLEASRRGWPVCGEIEKK